MLFNSLEYPLFFALLCVTYFVIPSRSRWILLLAGSYAFYAYWKAAYLLLILFSTVVDYAAAIGVDRARDRMRKRLFLGLSLASNLGLLFGFKYYGLFRDTAEALMETMGSTGQLPVLQLLLPVGISFYTFQTLSYSIDVYRGDRPAERHFGKFALYVAFFPQLVAGPIERSTRLLPQFHEHMTFDYDRVTSGLRLMAWGFLKKMVIADRLAVVVNHVYGNTTDYTGLPLIIATYAFAFQIYIDFSAYSDIAIGSARVLGFRMMENFDRPYLSRSVQEFWHRWHISLSTWFRDYLYLPLGGNRVTRTRWIINISAVFILSGLWHGAAWTFAVWGALHGGYLVISRLTASIRDRAWNRLPWDLSRVRRLLGILITFHLTCLAWVFFRAESIDTAFYVIGHAVQGLELRLTGNNLGLPKLEFGIAILGILVTEVAQGFRKGQLTELLSRYPMARWTAYSGAIVILFFLGKLGRSEFIYFQF